MLKTISLLSLPMALFLVFGFGVPAVAQTGQIYGEITGKVVDAQRGVLPGVTVTLSGPAIMGVRTTTTSGSGTYHFPLLPSGTYALRFGLLGFSTFLREGLIVAARTTVRQDATLEVATLEETVTVTGESPVVDATNTNVGQRLQDELLEATPTARSLMGAASLAPGVVMATRDIAGLKAWSVPAVVGHGSRAYQVNFMGVHAEGAQQNGSFYYVDFNAMEEVSVETAGKGAESAVAGATINIMPKDGGNEFSGSAYFIGTEKGLVSNNIDERLQAQGVSIGTQPLRLYDSNFDLGGRIVRDRLWWHSSFREFQYYDRVIGFPKDHFARLRNFNLRLSSQVTTNNRVSALYAYRLKEEPLRDASLTVPAESSHYQYSPTHFEAINWTSVLADRTFLEVATGLYTQYINRKNPPEWEALDPPISPSIDLGTGVRFGQHSGGARFDHGYLFTTNGAVTHYLDGWLGANHQIKTGFNLGYGWGNRFVPLFGDTEYRYVHGIPAEIRAYNTPVKSEEALYSLAGFVQDRITYGRASLNLGLRYSFYKGWLPEQVGGGGRWVPETVYPKLETGFNWSNVAPRLGLSVLLTPDGRNVAKAFYGRYLEHLYTPHFTTINPNGSDAIATYGWFGDLNGNRVVDEGEYNPAPLSVFQGTANSIDPDFEQPKIDEVTFSYERELRPDVGLSVSWVQRWFRDNYADVNVGIPLAAYTPRTFADPGPDNLVGTGDDGTITLYDVRPGFRGQDAFQRQTVPGTKNYKSLQVAVTKRMANNWQLQGSYTWSRDDGIIRASRQAISDPNNPNQQLDSHKFGRDGTDQPHAFKLLLNYRSPWGFVIGANAQVLSGLPRDREFRARLAQGNTTVRAARRGTFRSDTMKLLALKIDRPFSIGEVRVGPFVEFHNLFNSSAAVSYAELTQAFESQAALDAANLGSTAYFGRITEIIVPRVIKVGARLQF